MQVKVVCGSKATGKQTLHFLRFTKMQTWLKHARAAAFQIHADLGALDGATELARAQISEAADVERAAVAERERSLLESLKLSEGAARERLELAACWIDKTLDKIEHAIASASAQTQAEKTKEREETHFSKTTESDTAEDYIKTTDSETAVSELETNSIFTETNTEDEIRAYFALASAAPSPTEIVRFIVPDVAYTGNVSFKHAFVLPPVAPIFNVLKTNSFHIHIHIQSQINTGERELRVSHKLKITESSQHLRYKMLRTATLRWLLRQHPYFVGCVVCEHDFTFLERPFNLKTISDNEWTRATLRKGKQGIIDTNCISTLKNVEQEELLFTCRVPRNIECRDERCATYIVLVIQCQDGILRHWCKF
jgi:hypothetical protein